MDTSFSEVLRVLSEKINVARLYLANADKAVLLRSGGIAALALILQYLLTSSSKRPKYVVNLAQVGTPAGVKRSEEEYDVIIVGGGVSSLNCLTSFP